MLSDNVMREHLRKIRKSSITKEELIADGVFLFISAVISFIMALLFDVHHSFYRWPILPLEFIFKTYEPYVLFTSVGTIFGFLVIKLLLFGIKEEKI